MDDIRSAVQETLSLNAQTLSLSSLDVDELPAEIFSDELKNASILTFTVDYNDLSELPKDIGSLCHLEEFSATGNRLKSLPNELSRLSKLKKLILNENELDMVPAELSKLHNLEVLNLMGNRVTKWHGEFGEGFIAMTELHLDENQLRSLPESFGLMTGLRVLEVCDNRLSTLPKSFGSLTQLETLNLSRNEIKELPNSFAKLSKLKSLDFSDNKLANLPERFESAPKLEYLYADNNLLKILPLWFESLCSLIHLGLSDNQLIGSPLPPNFGSGCGKTLKFLDLGGNSIRELPDSMGELKVLDNLHLGSTINELERRNFQNGNWLRTLPESFGWMKKISKIHLDENQLIKLPESFPCLENLEWLDLGQNRLEVLPDLFGNLTKLWYLQLSKNHIHHLPESFGNLTKLIDLRLDNNNLTELPASFDKLSDLQTLDLFNNHLHVIPKVLLRLKKLIRLDLDRNDLKLKAHKVPKLVGAQVKYPERNPELKDNWRGKTRADKVGYESVEVNTVDCLEDFDEGDNTEEEVEDNDSGDVLFNESALRNAMRKGLSIWKSHTGPEQREVDERAESPLPVIYQPPLPINSSNSDIFDDAEETDTGLSETVTIDDNDNHVNGSNSSDTLDEHEDWDKEIEQSRQPYPVTRQKCIDDAKLTLVNELQQLIISYPPAAQALTSSAVYTSVVFDDLGKPIRESGAVLFASEEGQFDDAEIVNTRTVLNPSVFV